ncbi:MAG: sugar phosphate isomerase/epimerase [Gammaproteobacteria bacterium]|nr:sugar phosphate isomerase/epimerase [Gammaproteobacteria bacterium]
MSTPPDARWTRRRFLARSTGASVGALLAPGAIPLLQATPLGGPAGIQLYAVKDELRADPARTLRTIAQIGFGEVEAAGLAGLPVSEFRKLLDDANLRCPSAHLQFDARDPGPAFEQAHALGAHYAASGSLRDAVSAAARTGPPLAPAAQGMTLDEARRTAELANRIGEEARRSGLQYVYHNHDFEFAAESATCGYDVLLKETEPALVQFEIDCGWMVLGGRDPREYFARYPGRFPMVHVKDFLPVAARGAGHPGAELGHGMIDYGPIFAVAEKSGLKHYFAEQEGPFTRMSQLDAARQAYDYLRNIK